LKKKSIFFQIGEIQEDFDIPKIEVEKRDPKLVEISWWMTPQSAVERLGSAAVCAAFTIISLEMER